MREKVKNVNFAIAKLSKMTLVDERDRKKVKIVNFSIAKLSKMTLVDERESQNCKLCYSKTIENDFGG